MIKTFFPHIPQKKLLHKKTTDTYVLTVISMSSCAFIKCFTPSIHAVKNFGTFE